MSTEKSFFLNDRHPPAVKDPGVPPRKPKPPANDDDDGMLRSARFTGANSTREMQRHLLVRQFERPETRGVAARVIKKGNEMQLHTQYDLPIDKKISRGPLGFTGTAIISLFALLIAFEVAEAGELDPSILSYSAEIEFLYPDYHTQAVYMNGFLDAMVYTRLNGLPEDELFNCLFGHDFVLQNGYLFSDPVAEAANEKFRAGEEEFSVADVAMDVIPEICTDRDGYFKW